MGWDIKIFYLFNNLAGKRPILDWFIVFLSDYFQYLVGIIFILLLAYSQYSRREKWRIFLVTTVSIAVSRLGIVELVRIFYHRLRPFLVLPATRLTTDGSYSFPSGHAAFFFAMAAAIYLYDKKWGAWFFAFAVAISLSRIAAGVHYPSDIFGGAAVGIAVAYSVFWLDKNYLSNRG